MALKSHSIFFLTGESVLGRISLEEDLTADLTLDELKSAFRYLRCYQAACHPP